MQPSHYKLLISDLRLEVYLGCNVNEKEVKQTVRVDIAIQFLELPLGAKTDLLQDTTCYAKMVEHIHRFLGIDTDKQNETREFNLIEYLCAEIHRATVEFLTNHQLYGTLVSVTLNKQNAPVVGVHGDISFTICSA